MTNELWTVTFLFNAVGDPRRLANYHIFRQRLGCRLLAVELAPEGKFQLNHHDADLLLQFSSGGQMWQKERLFNIGVAHLPAPCTAVAQIDADIVFSNENWKENALAALNAAPVVQMFSRCVRLPQGEIPGMQADSFGRDQSCAVVEAISNGSKIDECFAPPVPGAEQKLTWGGAWAFRRDLLERHGVYDAHILFGGDTALAAACFGAIDAVERRHHLSAAHGAHYRAWANRWFADVKGRVAVLPGTAYHLWHGDMSGRYNRDWHKALGALAFDPAKDLVTDHGQPWRWAGNKPQLEKLLADYFAFRATA